MEWLSKGGRKMEGKPEILLDRCPMEQVSLMCASSGMNYAHERML